MQCPFYLPDTNECASNNGGCDDVCSNSDGSYTCSCSRGLVLSQDSHACICKPVQSYLGHFAQSVVNGAFACVFANLPSIFMDICCQLQTQTVYLGHMDVSPSVVVTCALAEISATGYRDLDDTVLV